MGRAGRLTVGVSLSCQPVLSVGSAPWANPWTSAHTIAAASVEEARFAWYVVLVRARRACWSTST